MVTFLYQMVTLRFFIRWSLFFIRWDHCKIAACTDDNEVDVDETCVNEQKGEDYRYAEYDFEYSNTAFWNCCQTQDQ